ncbi:iron-containing alcohol dehydrogenase family protein [Haloarcula japonica]|uniref:Alcohol dehydrogenase, class IV n=1 Tax=Haloarcula japonica (strain ATCC 49778 / DSM 6131 / JCM 7785 / NBRC 101032 / NCIMB 13157 / TR-1) TaxID=1227453 RepID=M0L0E1_HALJT|nr:iron-containing alcohol dehydrogenase family protein [Haloarcula japonica]EMA26996.1 alcohol dehydrogenase, class IV [Haloarcula japonica DSM 6131]
MDGNAYSFEYQPGAIHHGPGVVAEFGSELERYGASRALIVTDATLADVPAIMDPLRDGIGDRLHGVFDDVTPEKYLRDAAAGARRVREDDIDALVPLGGGSSLDMAKQISVLAGHDRPVDEVTDEILDRGEMVLPDDEVVLTDIFAVPTTLPGADLSQVAGVKLSLDPAGKSKDEIPSAGVSDSRLMPTAVFHDLNLFATTPNPILARSAMNGFDKGIEMIYTRHHNPLTDGTAIRGVRLLYESLPALADDSTSEEDLSQILRGIAAAQYGLSTPNAYRASVIHSFGHAIARNYNVQQGVAHAIAAPHVLRYLFEQVDGRRDLLAEAFDVRDEAATPEETADAIVDAVTQTRDALDLPSQLRSIDGTEKAHFPSLAKAVIEDPFMDAGPEHLDAAQSDLEAVFEQMW